MFCWEIGVFGYEQATEGGIKLGQLEGLQMVMRSMIV